MTTEVDKSCNGLEDSFFLEHRLNWNLFELLPQLDKYLCLIFFFLTIDKSQRAVLGNEGGISQSAPEVMCF